MIVCSVVCVLFVHVCVCVHMRRHELVCMVVKSICDSVFYIYIYIYIYPTIMVFIKLSQSMIAPKC